MIWISLLLFCLVGLSVVSLYLPDKHHNYLGISIAIAGIALILGIFVVLMAMQVAA